MATALGPEFAAYTAATVAAERARRAQPDDLIRQIAVIAGLVALFVGAFVIRNTFTIVLAAEARELALLRCIGAGRGQIRRSALLKSLLVGGIAALGGLPFGVAVAWGLGVLLESAGEIRADVTGTAPRIHARTVLVAVAVGVTTAVFSAWGPARRASRVAPVAALRGEVFALARRENRLRTAIGTVAVLAGVGLVLAGGLGDPVRSGLLTAGTVATGVGVLVLGPVVARALAGLIGAPISRARGVVGELARGNAVRSPRRTSATVLPLVIGLALTAFLMTVAAGTKAWAVGGLDRAVRADFQLAAVPGDPPHASSRPPMRPEVAGRLAGLPELAAVAEVRDRRGRRRGRRRRDRGRPHPARRHPVGAGHGRSVDRCDPRIDRGRRGHRPTARINRHRARAPRRTGSHGPGRLRRTRPRLHRG